MLLFLFWVSLFFILYTYLGYPFILLLWSRISPKKVKKSYLSPDPSVSVIIAVRNEEKDITGRIENLMQQDFSAERMEIIIISDGSKDSTNDIIFGICKKDVPANHYLPKAIEGPNIKFISYEKSKGKPHAINLGVQQAKGDFLVFTDARQRFEPNAIKELVANFNDASVGCVSGELIFNEDTDTGVRAEMKFYWEFEKRIRKMESQINSVPGATGAIYAIRKSLFEPMPENTLLDDVFLPMHIVLKAYRAVFDPKAIAHDIFSKDFAQEKKRKIRTLVGNYQLFKIIPALLSPRQNPIFFAYISHKTFRLFVPLFFLIVLFSSLILNGFFYNLFFIILICMILLAFAALPFSRIPYLCKLNILARTFVTLNYFALLAFIHLILPGKKKLW
jgi:cellulose synthase/poly-beta-1,6-N-acetylglucosamine synthase-like glycosyltransferase